MGRTCAVRLILASLTIVSCKGGGNGYRNDGSAVATASASASTPPADPTGPDPFRWMEDEGSDRFRQLLTSEADSARRVLSTLVERPWFRAKVASLTGSTPESAAEATCTSDAAFFAVKQRDGYALVRLGGDGQRTVLYQTPRKPGTTYAIESISASPDSRHVALVESENGSEDGTLRIFDVSKRAFLSEAASFIRSPSIHWLPGKSAFFYAISPSTNATTASSERYRRLEIRFHRLGTGFASDQPILNSKSSSFVDDDDNPQVRVDPSGKYAFAFLQRGVRPDISVYAKSTDVIFDQSAQWAPQATSADRVLDLSIGAQFAYLLTAAGSENLRALRARLPDLSTKNAEVLRGEGPGVLQSVVAVGTDAYVSGLVDGVVQLERVHGGSRSLVDVRGSVDSLVQCEAADRALIHTEDWFHPAEWLAVDGSTAKVLRATDTAGLEYSRGRVDRFLVSSADGTTVPVTVLRRDDVVLGPTVPTILNAYGAYGIAVTPRFSPERIAWVDRGGVFVIAHVRGGGERGEPWHEAGIKERKESGVQDYLAVARHLVSANHVSPSRLIAVAGSAGGQVVGTAFVTHPELFGGAAFRAAQMNPVRGEFSEGGPANVPEFGSVRVPSELDALKRTDPYMLLQPGRQYPQVLLLVGANDPRVPVWQSAKFAARMREVAGPAAAHMSVSFDEGHGSSSTGSQTEDALADLYSFAWSRANPPSKTDNAARDAKAISPH